MFYLFLTIFAASHYEGQPNATTKIVAYQESYSTLKANGEVYCYTPEVSIKVADNVSDIIVKETDSGESLYLGITESKEYYVWDKDCKIVF